MCLLGHSVSSPRIGRGPSPALLGTVLPRKCEVAERRHQNFRRAGVTHYYPTDIDEDIHSYGTITPIVESDNCSPSVHSHIKCTIVIDWVESPARYIGYYLDQQVMLPAVPPRRCITPLSCVNMHCDSKFDSKFMSLCQTDQT